MEPVESPDHLSSCPNKLGAGARSGPVFTAEGREERRERDLKTFHRMLFEQSVSNCGSGSNPCRENKLSVFNTEAEKGCYY